MDISNIDLVFNVAQLLKERVGATRRFHIDASDLVLDDGNEEADLDRLEAQNVHGEAKATRLSDGLLVQGDVEATVQLQCSRCLDTFSMPVEASLEEQFQPTVDVLTGYAIQRADFEENDAAFPIDSNHMMDLTEPVRQALLVALPMKPLCREDCKGICAECGANLNEWNCGHTQQKADDRWSGLRELRLDDFPTSDNVN